MKISQLRNMSLATFMVCIGGIVGGFWIWQLQTEDLSTRKITKWEPNVIDMVSSENSQVELTDMGEALTRPIFRRSRKPFDPSEVIKVAEPVVTAAPAPTPTPTPTPTPAPVQQAPPTQVVEQVAVAPPPTAQTAETLQLSLKGIYSFDGTWKALFVSPSLPEGEWLAIGSEISGWKLTKVDPNVVTISLGDQKIELKLYVDNQLNALGSPQP
jgi:hypothetical protein